ncbi:PREDICTED: zinc finger MYND domain-containing protein 10-like [Priapulus caudatus]|uniref:Zinc finger MYND domain-containing protein 10-like n=1 Tax=Priapulus caudatus TaxID=37621 RepID=A0ABM1F975_PRICU|nr:PREDICTED: zinc finger MYND domain-containing protein 10-like [Priapulus caudatus]
MIELIRQNEELEFNISMRATSIISYITDHLSMLPLSVTSRLLTTHNVPALLVELVENAPWRRRGEKGGGGGGGEEKYIDDAWQAVEPADRLRLTKLEGQVMLIGKLEGQVMLIGKLEGQVMLIGKLEGQVRLIGKLEGQVMLIGKLEGQVMLIGKLERQVMLIGKLERQVMLIGKLQGQVMLIGKLERQVMLIGKLERQVPEMRAAVLRAHEGRWEELARSQAKFLLQQSKEDMREDARRLASAYDIDTLESVMCEPPRCALCGQEAAKRCSRCRNEWYCRRECQVDHWNKHKIACDLMADPGK